MINRNHLHLMEVISILLFSLLANYSIGLNVDFNAKIDFIVITKLLLLFLSSFIFYTVHIQLKEISLQAKEEYDMEKDMLKKASNSVDKRYFNFYSVQKKSINMKTVISLLLGICFFLVDAIHRLF